mmetsp:Transcript_31826/g.50801  ORF Transcript_31826/g.50801 Transcript_31826/m.50801 type:complete len:487 (+) Transcript_31826:242-1702(+)
MKVLTGFLTALVVRESSAMIDADAVTGSGPSIARSKVGTQIKDSWLIITKLNGGKSCVDVQNMVNSQAQRKANWDDASIKATANAIGKECIIHYKGKIKNVSTFQKNHQWAQKVQPDRVVEAAAAPLSWGLDRIDQLDLPLSRTTFNASHTGRGVNIYILDTGIYPSHSDFGGRAQIGRDYINESPAQDNHGHGTHCSGTAAGTKYGVAKGANLIGVKVLSRSGSGSWSGVIAGMAWATSNSGGASGVISMSLSGGKYAAANTAAIAASNAGMIVVVAAGNSNRDACLYSPASAAGEAGSDVLSIGASDISDNRASYSNYGRCTSFFAPGTSIKSTWIGGTTATRTISGTSMATPHVAGVAAVLLEKHNGRKAEAMEELLRTLVPDTLRGATPNKFVQVPRGDAGPAPTPAPTVPPSVRPSTRPSSSPDVCTALGDRNTCSANLSCKWKWRRRRCVYRRCRRLRRRRCRKTPHCEWNTGTRCGARR